MAMKQTVKLTVYMFTFNTLDQSLWLLPRSPLPGCMLVVASRTLPSQ
jgi:hypothetical protein